MKIMMKIVALTLAVMMILCSAALAETKTMNTTGDSGSDVYATYTSADADVVYYVTMTWGDMNFKVTEKPGAWDPSTHKYGGTTYEWAPAEENGNRISVTNSSNTDLDVAMSFAPDANLYFEQIISELNDYATQGCGETDRDDNNNFSVMLMRALYGGDANSDANVGGVLTFEGTPFDDEGNNQIDGKTKIGTITVTITHPEDAEITTEDYTAR